MTALLGLAFGALLVMALLFAAWRAPAMPGPRTLGIGLLAVAALLGVLRQIALAVPLAMLGFSFLRRAAALPRAIPTPGSLSEVRTRYLAMTLDHDSGALDGEVLEGPFKGARLSRLSGADLAALADLLDSDEESLALLLAYLDRRGGGPKPAPPPGDAAAMSTAEAFRILGLEPGASLGEVRAAHRRLMRKVHPDLGGSDALAALINAAKAHLDAQ